MIKEVKICEVCDAVNPAMADECFKCNSDLAYVPIKDIDDEKVEKTDKVIEDTPATVNEPIEEIRGELDQGRKTVILTSRFFENPVDGKSFEIPIDGCILGRNGDLEERYFNQFMVISNRHAEVKYVGGDMIIKDLSSTNGTRVNNMRLQPGEEKVVKIGDSIKLANIEFVII